jgi:hypothetical protein
MIVGVPIFAVLFAFMKTLVETKLSTRELSPDTAKYLRLIYINVDNKEYVGFESDNKKSDFQISQFKIKSQEILKRKQNENNNSSTIKIDLPNLDDEKKNKD